ncbi:MAG: hypothetical protein A2170_15655 [Deltaproteobacteria bacterium RBG_13_53_10]|nr:MAG: hypothetical protein A2170_15655 [Deltaproteobacteria bacterium RBG_13_53_10]
MIEELRQASLKELQEEAFGIRKQQFGNELTFSIPGTVTYQDSRFSSQRSTFSAISLTGNRCGLGCEHCKGKLLETMTPAQDPETLRRVVLHLKSRGALGVLISGGADPNGEVPLKEFIPVLGAIKEEDPRFRIIVHTGLVRREIAEGLKDARVDQILIDVIGDDDTIREVYHLNRRVQDYEETLRMLKEMGHRLAPHIIIGHHFGEIRGEWRALEIITGVGVETIVLVVMKPLEESMKARFRVPKPEETSKISAIARILNPKTPIRMGCIRPAHPWKAEMERGFIDSGANTIAYPLQATIEYAERIGLDIRSIEMCCSLL